MNGAKGQPTHPSTNTPEQPSVGSMRTGGVNAYAPSSWNTNNGLGYFQQPQGQGMNGAKGSSGGGWPAWSGGPHPLAVLAAHFINSLGQGGMGAESDSSNGPSGGEATGNSGYGGDYGDTSEGESSASATGSGGPSGDDAAGGP